MRLERFVECGRRDRAAAAVLALFLGGTVLGGPATARYLHVGSVDLHSCAGSEAYCGEIERALDPTGSVPGKLPIHVEYYRHSRPGRAAGTLVATEGGPGYPATESRADYLDLFKPLMGTHDVLFMDNRGTGRSAAIECPALQTAPTWTVEAVTACGESLGDRAPLYGTAYAADDLAAVLQALGIGKIDLYGDSYGTYFEQAFAVRHPEILRSVVLDGAYPLTAPDYAWYPTYAPAMRAKFDLTCARSPVCAVLPGNSMAHIAPALELLRNAPFRGRGRDVEGNERAFPAAASQLAILMFGNAPAFSSVRETDAAARAFVAGDSAPLLRLMAETVSAVDSRDPAGDATRWSAGLAAAVMCHDPPQIFDMRLAPTARRLDRDRALAERRRAAPDTYAPFTIDEFRGMPLDYSFLDLCVGWPVAPAAHPAAQVGMDAVYPDVPVLVISGELDDLTSVADGAVVAAAFAHGIQVTIANSFHVNALPRARSACGAHIVREFVRTLRVRHTGCATRVPPLRLVPRFAATSTALEPARALPGNTASLMELRRVCAAVFTVGDVLARVDANSSGHGVGLRGGGYSLKWFAGAVRADLDGLRWTDDVAVSGTLWRSSSRQGKVHASLRVTPATGEPAGTIWVTWDESQREPMAQIRGHVGAAAVRAAMPAP